MRIVPKKSIRYPLALEREYARVLVRHVDALMNVIRSYIPQMKRLLERTNIAFDDDEDDVLTGLMEQIAASVAMLPLMTPDVERTYEKVVRYSGRQYDACISSVFGSPPLLTAQQEMAKAQSFEQLKRLWVNDNLDRIKRIDSDVLSKIKGNLADRIIGTVEQSRLTRDLVEDIRHIAHVERDHAILIGRDQVGKLNGRINEYQQRQNGIDSYIWRTTGDERVRKSHRERSDREYKWTEPPADGHPGQPIQCRCVADPIIDLDKMGLRPKKGTYNEVGSGGIIEQTEGPAEKVERLRREINVETNTERRNQLFKDIEAARVDAAKQKVMLSSGLQNSYSADDLKAMQEIFAKAPENARIAWNRCESRIVADDIKTKKGKAWYSINSRRINLNLAQDRKGSQGGAAYAVTFHESGHLIDFAKLKDVASSTAYKNGLFSKTLRDEVEAYIDKTMKKIALENGQRRVSKFRLAYQAHKEIEDKLWSLPKSTTTAVSDIFSGATKNKIRDGWIHETKYWSEDAAHLEREAFANMYAATMVSPEGVELVKEYFPESYKIFEEILDEIAKGAV